MFKFYTKAFTDLFSSSTHRLPKLETVRMALGREGVKQSVAHAHKGSFPVSNEK